MGRVLALFLVLQAVPLGASEMLVFKKDSPYRGGAMRVASYEQKGDRLLIRAENGDVFSALAASVDWERSRAATAKLAQDEQAASERAAAEAVARHRTDLAQSRPREMSLLEASRRYGVDKPAVSFSSQLGEVAPAAPAAGAAPEAGGSGGAPPANPEEAPQVKMAADRLARAKAEREKLAAEIDKLKKDTNPDPQWAAQRASYLDEKTRRLTALDNQIKGLEAEVGRERAAAATKAKG
jgi:hypothetical protein